MTATRAIINNRADLLGYTFSEVAAAIGCTPVTFRKKCTAPELLTGREIRQIVTALKLSEEQTKTIVEEAIK